MPSQAESKMRVGPKGIDPEILNLASLVPKERLKYQDDTQ